MPEQVIVRAIERLAEASLIGDRLIVCWHCGEPLSLPIAYYRDAIELIKGIAPPSCEIQFKFQTNGTLITDDWCNFFLQHGIQVGVSIDGPSDLHDANRRTRSGKGTFESTLRGIRRLKAAGVDYSIICVLTAPTMDHPQALFDFFTTEGIDHVCFNIEETEGIHRSKLIGEGSAVEKFRRFFGEYMDLVSRSKTRQWVREIDSPFQSLFIAGRNKTSNQQVTPFEIVTVDWEGNLSTFSPELIGMPNAEFGDFKFGNLVTDSIADIRGSLAFVRTLKAINKGVELCRNTCDYFDICGGGAPSNKYFENNNLASSETNYCRAVIKTTADLLLERVTTDRFSAHVR
jgi:uncharacterized protein